MNELASQFDPKLVPIAQFISSTLFGFASLLVAGVALVYGYRNNFGWRPLALLYWGMAGGGSLTPNVEMRITSVVWNRRKYPILLEGIVLKIDGIKLEEYVKGYPYDRSVYITHDGLGMRPEKTLEAHERFEHTFKAPYTEGDYKEIALIKGEIRYFDLRKGKSKKLRANLLFAPAWGTKKMQARYLAHKSSWRRRWEKKKTKWLS